MIDEVEAKDQDIFFRGEELGNANIKCKRWSAGPLSGMFPVVLDLRLSKVAGTPVPP